jgi:hypothetical protein
MRARNATPQPGPVITAAPGTTCESRFPSSSILASPVTLFLGMTSADSLGSPTPGVLTGWMELGAFNVIYRNHGTKGSRDANRGSTVRSKKPSVAITSRLATSYCPISTLRRRRPREPEFQSMRPMFLEFPEDSTLQTNESEFMFGPRLPVAPKVTEFVGPYEVRLPAGEWYDVLDWTESERPGADGRPSLGPSLGFSAGLRARWNHSAPATGSAIHRAGASRTHFRFPYIPALVMERSTRMMATRWRTPGGNSFASSSPATPAQTPCA